MKFGARHKITTKKADNLRRPGMYNMLSTYKNAQIKKN
jgi:hypothetical protein